MAATVAVVDYGMGNLRSVSQAVDARARRGQRRRGRHHRASPTQVLRRRPRRAAGPGRDARLHARAARLRPAGGGARRRRDASRCWACASACRCCSIAARSRTPPGLGLIPGEVVRFRLEGRLQADGSRYKVPQMGWNRVRQAARASAVGTASPTTSWFYFVHSFYAAPSDARHSAGDDRLRRRALPRRWRGIIFSRPSSTPRRAPPSAWRSTATSCTGCPDALPSLPRPCC